MLLLLDNWVLRKTSENKFKVVIIDFGTARSSVIDNNNNNNNNNNKSKIMNDIIKASIVKDNNNINNNEILKFVGEGCAKG